MNFLRTWVPLITNYAFVCSKGTVCAMIMYYHAYDGVYIRLLCSRLKCGSIALNYLKDKFPTDTITLNSEEKAVPFYERHGFELCLDAPMEDGCHPLMILRRMPSRISTVCNVSALTLTCIAVMYAAWWLNTELNWKN